MRKMQCTLVAMLVLAVVATAGCSAEAQVQVSRDTPVVLISIDTLRSDRLPAYGYDRLETPAIDRLRRQGVLFERAYTHVPLTLPAHTSILSGVLPPTHGVRDNLGYAVDPSSTPLLQQSLKSAGFATGAAVSAYVLRHATGLAAGFDVYLDDVEYSSGAGLQAIQRPGAETLEAVKPWLRSVAGKPFFLFFHLFEPHFPYDPPAHLAGRYSEPYDGEVVAADEVVGGLLRELEELGVYQSALIVLLSDHGEGLGEHGEDEHGLFLYRSTLQVPLIIKLPGNQRAGATVANPVQLIDVAPTILSLLGLPLDDRIEGGPLLGRSPARTDNDPIYAETYFPRFHFGWSELTSVIAGRYQLIDAPRPELYDLVNDPAQKKNLIRSSPDTGEQLRSKLARFDRSYREPEAVSDETRSRLQALGYVGQASVGTKQDLPDPKDGVGTLADLRAAYDRFAAQDYESAVGAFEAIVTANPLLEDAWEYLALSQLALGRVDDAVLTYRAAVESLPNAGRLSLRLAMLLYRLGRLDEAFVQANLAITFDPAAAHILLGQIAFHRGDVETAEAEAREALAEDPSRPGPWLVLADVAVARGEPEAAVDLLSDAMTRGVTDDAVRAKLALTHIWMAHFDDAASVLSGFEDSDDPEILMAFAKLASAREQWSEARSWYEKVLRHDPHNLNAKLNLGLVLLTAGQAAEARPVLEDVVARNPQLFDGWNALGAACARQGDLQAAISAWERAFGLQPEALDVLFNLGLVHAQAGHLERAATAFEAYVAKAGAGPQRDRAQTMAERLRRRLAEQR